MATSGFTFTVEPDITPGGPYSYGTNFSRMSESQPDRGSLAEAWRSVGGTIEAMSPQPSGTVAFFTKQNLFAKSVHAAFYDHHPLVISPDVVWLTIAQGLANHVDQNAATMRDKFVSHEGKMELVVSRPEFVKGSPNNDWEGVFPEFSEQIAKNSKPGITELIEGDFSTTGPVEKVVSHITLMDAVQHYFSYTMCCGCGFPSITLSGTPEDWDSIRAKAEQLRQFDLDWWLHALLPALDEFAKASRGEPDLHFWRSLCHINVGTSFPVYEPLTGWIQVFFPYLIKPGIDHGFDTTSDDVPKKALKRNSNLDSYMESWHSQITMENFNKANPGTKYGVKLENFPPAMSAAPFTYKDLSTGRDYKMSFMGGVTCLVQHEATGAIEPKIGWAVMEAGESMG